MKKNTWLFLFSLALAGDLLGIFVASDLLRYIFKPLIVLAVAGFFLNGVKNCEHPLKKWILFALFFSWVGDILLMFDNRSELFFLAGLGSFLLAHIFYIIFFRGVWKAELIKFKFVFLLLAAIYYAGLIIWLYPYLGDKRIPVLIYGIVISVMVFLAMHMSLIRGNKGGNHLVFGAVLFILSDSILAVNKFYAPFDHAGLFIMLTYGGAQLFISSGAARYISTAKSS